MQLKNNIAGRKKKAADPVRLRLQQYAFDWFLPTTGQWLPTPEIAEALQVSRRHVLSHIFDGSFDFVIDLRAPGTAQPYWRVLRPSFLRFGRRCRGEECATPPLEADLVPALESFPSILLARHLAAYFRCSPVHIGHLAGEFPDIGRGPGGSASLRIPRPQLLEFIKRRRV